LRLTIDRCGAARPERRQSVDVKVTVCAMGHSPSSLTWPCI
jgi:hypothetical protein